MKSIVVLIILAVGCYIVFTPSSVDYSNFKHLPAQALAPDPPIQKAVESPEGIYKNEFFLRLTHKFSIKALVLSKKNYRFGDDSKLSPVDLALGWGPMSDPDNLKPMKFSQSGRFLHWGGEPGDLVSWRVANVNVSHSHMVAANDNIEKKLKSVRAGDVVSLKGYLVSATIIGDNGWYWKSSLNRVDEGNGACELFYLEDIEIKRY